jgi:hypothetical protein
VSFDERVFATAQEAYEAITNWPAVVAPKQEAFNVIEQEFKVKVKEFQDFQEQNDPNKFVNVEQYNESNLPTFYKEILLRKELDEIQEKLNQIIPGK